LRREGCSAEAGGKRTWKKEWQAAQIHCSQPGFQQSSYDRQWHSSRRNFGQAIQSPLHEGKDYLVLGKGWLCTFHKELLE
jgi:hypothetical protein